MRVVKEEDETVAPAAHVADRADEAGPVPLVDDHHVRTDDGLLDRVQQPGSRVV